MFTRQAHPALLTIPHLHHWRLLIYSQWENLATSLYSSFHFSCIMHILQYPSESEAFQWFAVVQAVQLLDNFGMLGVWQSTVLKRELCMKHPFSIHIRRDALFLKDEMGCYLDSIGASVIYDTVYWCIPAKLFTAPEKEKRTSRKLSRKITQHEASLDRFIAWRERT